MLDTLETNITPSPVKNINTPCIPTQTIEGITEDFLANEDKQTESSQEKIEYVSNTPKHNLTPILLNYKNKRPISEASLPLNSPSPTNLPSSPIATNKPTKKKLKSVPGRALSQI